MLYLQNGIKTNHIDPESEPEFYIMEWSPEQYMYPQDSLLFSIESYFNQTRHDLIESYFSTYEEYMSIISSIPNSILDSGLYSNNLLSRDDFEKLINEINSKTNDKKQLLNKILYFYDVDFVLQSMQNLVIGMNNDFINYFKILSDVNFRDNLKDGVYEITGPNTSLLASILGGYFVKLGSVLDLLTKYTYEVENPNLDFSKYKKLACRSLLYGNRSTLKINNTKKTLFYKDTHLGEIESIRNEIVHNGSWEHTPRVYYVVKEGIVTERFMLFPDMKDGNYCRYVNRYHFFSMDKKVNNILPDIHISFLKKLKTTLYKLCTPDASDALLEFVYDNNDI